MAAVPPDDMGTPDVKKCLIAVVLLAALTFALAGCSSSQSSTAGSGCKACAVGKAGGTAWCDACNAGFVDGQKITCKGCYIQKSGGEPCTACKG